jgi:hypothetical protein
VTEKQINSNATLATKRYFRIGRIFFPVLCLYSLLGGRFPQKYNEIITFVFGASGFLFFLSVFRWYLELFTFSEIDEVYDCGSFLRIKTKDLVEEIPFTNIKKVSFIYSNPSRIKIDLIDPIEHGNEFYFVPEYPLIGAFTFSHPVYRDLASRIERVKFGIGDGKKIND